MLGVDIGVAAIKLAVMRRQRRGWCLQACAVQPLPCGMPDHCGPDSDIVGDALKRGLGALPVRVRDAAVAVASADAITRTISLEPGLRGQDIDNRLAIAAEQHLPFSLSEASMDYCRLPGHGDARMPEQDALLVACRRTEITRRVTLLEACGLRAVVADLDALALARIIGEQSPNTMQVVLDLGAGGFRLHAFAQGRLQYSRAHQAGVASVAGPSALSSQVAEPAPARSLVQEVRRAIQLFLISTACEQEVVIKLVGGQAAQPGLAAAISSACGRPVTPVQPLADLTIHARVAPAAWLASVPQLALACALAMRSE